MVKYTTKGQQKGAAMRDLCKKCQQRPVAINYRKDNKVFYRSTCDHCSRKRADGKPKWMLAGYQKKNICDKCGYTSKYQEQFNLFYIDGNVNNCRYSNLKTVCANCQRILHKFKLPWKQGDLTPDF
jgi:hypothetical protein